MKMIDVLIMMAEGNLKEGTILKFVDSCNEIVSYIYDEEMNAFYDKAQYDLGSEGEICGPFLNKKVELIPPKEEKYLIKVTFMGFSNRYLTYSLGENDVIVATERVPIFLKSRFTKSEMQSIPAVKKFLEDFQGEYELIRVEDNSKD